MSCTGVTSRDVGERYLQTRKDSKAAASPKSTPAWVTAHKSWRPGHTAHPAGSSTGWSVSLLGVSGDFELLQGAPLVSAFSNSKRLGIWGTLYSLQAAQQGGACPLQGPQLV